MQIKTDSGTDKQTIPPNKWTFIRFGIQKVVVFDEWRRPGDVLVDSILRVEYPKTGCPTTLRMRLVRWPGSPKEDETGHSEYDPIEGMTRHVHWNHNVGSNPDGLTMALRLWHNGTSPIVLDGRQVKTVTVPDPWRYPMPTPIFS